MKLGIVLPYLKSRGTENQALRLAIGLKDFGFRVNIFVTQGWGDVAVYSLFQQAGVEVIDVGPPLGVGEKKVSLTRSVRLAHLAEFYGCDVLLSRAGMTNLIASVSGLLAGIPVIASVSGSMPPAQTSVQSRGISGQFLKMAREVRWRLTFVRAKTIVCVSDEGALNLSAQYRSAKNRITSIRNGVDVQALLARAADTKNRILPEARFKVGFSGSLELNRKGFDTLIGAVESLVGESRMLDLLVVVVGSGQDERKIRDQVRARGLADNFLFVGESDNPHTYIGQCDLFVLPSRREGLPGALLEAMAVGVCSIAADCHTGPREIIRHARTGFLFPVGAAAHLAHLIRELRDDKKFRMSVARSGQRFVEAQFSERKMLEKYASELRKAIRFTA